LEKKSEPAWTIKQIFGRAIKGDCPINDETAFESLPICLHAPKERIAQASTNPEGQKWDSQKSESENLTCFRPPTNGAEFNLDLPEQFVENKLPLPSPKLHAYRSITGYGQEHGGIQSVLTNPSQTETLDVLYLESLPWYMKPYLHTLQASLSPPPSNDTSSAIKETYYRPALDRHRGTHLELRLSIPPASKLTLTYDFEKAILRYTEYPPDPNRGFDVAPAVIRVLPGPNDKLDSETRRRGIYVRTTSLLLPLPTPDFSMPYNVIILTSTVMALGFGGIFNILVRRFVAADEVPAMRLGVMLAAFRGRLLGRLKALFRGRRHEKTE
jgi:phosphatidylinositol glycan class T